jgi:hypothetical protein
MKHFRDEDWLDYLRGLSAPSQRAAMEQTLKEGCERCQKLFHFWRATIEVGVRVAGEKVPDEAVGIAAAAFATRCRIFRVQATARKARTLFDSLLRPAVAGVRGSEGRSRRLVKRSGRWIVDLRMENASNGHISIAGHVLQGGEWTGMPSVKEVTVMEGTEIVARTSANQFNEFHLEFTAAPNLGLFIEIEGERPILVNLPQSIEADIQERRRHASDGE